MASETVVPDIATPKHVEGKETEEVKAIEQEIVSSSKAEELATPTASATELKENTEDKKIHQPTVVEVKKVIDAPGLDVPARDSVAVKETAAPISDLSPVSEPAVKDIEKETKGQSEISDVAEPAVKSVEKPLDSSPTQEPGPEVETKLEEVSKESKIVETPELVAVEPEAGKEPEVLQSELKKVEKSESAAEEPEIGKQLEVSGSESTVPESVVEVEVKPQEQSENVEEVEKKSEQLERKENTEVELPKEEGVSIDKVEVTESSTEKDTGKDPEPVPCESNSDTFTFETPSVPIDEEVSVIPDVSNKAHGDNAQKEETVSDVVEESTKEAPLELAKAEEDKLEKNVKDEESTEPETTTAEEVGDSSPSTEVVEKPLEAEKASRDVEVVAGEKKEENVKDGIPDSVEATKDTEPLIAKTEEGGDSSSITDIAEKTFEEPEISKDVEVVTEEKKEEDAKSDIPSVVITKGTEPQSTETEGGDDSKSAAEVAENSIEGEITSKDIAVVTEEKKEENVNTDSSFETAKDTDLEGKVDVVSTVDAANEPVAEPKELELEPKAIAEETSKSDGLNLESSKDTDDSKTNEDPSKQEVLTKSVQKHSNSLISKVKHSIVKVKKAITGKSPSSKTITSDAKGDIKL